MKTLTKTLTRLAIALLFAFSITSCKEEVKETVEIMPKPEFNLTTAKAEIIAANKIFSTLYAATDSVGLSNAYTQDAKIMMNGAPAISGRENIQSVLSSIMNSGVSNISLNTIEVWGMDGLVVEEGELSLSVGDDVVDKGKYLVLWKKKDGKWKLFRDIFNSNLAAE